MANFNILLTGLNNLSVFNVYMEAEVHWWVHQHSIQKSNIWSKPRWMTEETDGLSIMARHFVC